MELFQVEKIAGELKKDLLAKGYAQRYTIIGKSMQYLIAPGNEITVRKVPPEEIRVGDVILMNDPENFSGLPVAHRVMSRMITPQGYAYRTKGDFGAKYDRRWINAEEVLGKVAMIHKRWSAFRIDTVPGKVLSIAVALVTVLLRGAQALRGKNR
jgi:signal peptidase I